MSAVKERCSCGATFEATGWLAGSHAQGWWLRHMQSCPNRRRAGEWRVSTTTTPTPAPRLREPEPESEQEAGM